MQSNDLPLQNLLKDLLPNDCEFVLNRLRYLPRLLMPQRLSALVGYGFNADTVKALEELQTKARVPHAVMTLLVIEQLFKLAGSDYEARVKLTRYLAHKMKRSTHTRLAGDIHRIVHKHYGKAFEKVELTPFVERPANNRAIRFTDPHDEEAHAQAA